MKIELLIFILKSIQYFFLFFCFMSTLKLINEKRNIKRIFLKFIFSHLFLKENEFKNNIKKFFEGRKIVQTNKCVKKARSFRLT